MFRFVAIFSPSSPHFFTLAPALAFKLLTGPIVQAARRRTNTTSFVLSFLIDD